MEAYKTYHDFQCEGFQINHTRRNRSFRMFEKHAHQQYELYYLLSGNRNYFVKDRVYPLNPGDLLLIGSNVLHKTIDGTSSSHERILIEFDERSFLNFIRPEFEAQLLRLFRGDCSLLHLDENHKKSIESQLFQIMHDTRSSKEDELLSIRSKEVLQLWQIDFIELLLRINQYESDYPNWQFEHLTPQHKRIHEIVQYINSHYPTPLHLEGVASEFFLSPAHLSRSFRKVTGFTFIEYLNLVRINEAKRLLQDPSLSLTYIAHEVGYQSSTHFGRVFRSICLISPRDYRKQNQKSSSL